MILIKTPFQVVNFVVRKSNFVVFIFVFACPLLSAQTKVIIFDEVKDQKNFGRFRHIEVKGHTGYHLYAGELLNESVNNGYGAVELRYGWQPKDPEHWTSRYGYASYGVGYYSGFVGDPDVLGKPNALFGFINFPLSNSRKRNGWEISQAVGLTYNLEPYDDVKNPNNDVIGSPFAVYFNLGVGGVYQLTREMDITYGIDYTHFSNGRITTPNYGMNMYGLNLGMRYHYNADQKFVDKSFYSQDLLQARFLRPKTEKSPRLRESSIEIYFGPGTVQNEEDKGTDNRYLAFSGVLDYRFKFNTMHAVTAGFDLFYDESMKIDYPEPEDRFLTGIHLGYDFMFGKMAIRLQGGAYLSDDKGKSPSYIRAAFRYDILDWLFAQVGVKTRKTSRADWAEIGFGFRPFKW